ncbi:nucleotidyltransferase domain-containing protein [Microbacterium murale]|uniref:Aminoglycoside-2''-adenylyltransferase n=1 Tax=Microbacterium murale TaxID=1081040 RepID=A0ABU0P5M4_9MICO|nr:hypothetical protein [Microbacterium murale]MDQ0642629.1 hypothetical protein [Microbacterium murale]
MGDEDAEFERLYGAWKPRIPADAEHLFRGYPGTWWIAGGWALEAFTGVQRHHEDIDPAVLREELPVLRRHLAARLDAWAAFSGALLPLKPDDRPDALADDILPDGCGQLWTRPGAAHPWEYDILLSPGTPDEWVYKRDATVRMPMADALWECDGIRYLQPEIQLLYKAKGQRLKDDADFAATLPFLDAARRAWLRDALTRTLPGHEWLADLTR